MDRIVSRRKKRKHERAVCCQCKQLEHLCSCCIDRPSGLTIATRAEIKDVLARCRACDGALSACDIEVLVRAYFSGFMTGDTSLYQLFLSPDFVTRPEFPGIPRGPEALVIIVQDARAFLPNITFTIEELIICGNKASTRSTVRGTASDGVSFVFATGDFFTFKDCQISENFAFVAELPSSTEVTTARASGRRGRF